MEQGGLETAQILRLEGTNQRLRPCWQPAKRGQFAVLIDEYLITDLGKETYHNPTHCHSVQSSLQEKLDFFHRAENSVL